MAGPFTSNFVIALETQERMEKLSVIMTIVGGARMLWPLGRAAVQSAIRLLANEKGVDLEEVFEKMGWTEFQSLSGPSEDSSASRMQGAFTQRLAHVPKTFEQQQPSEQQQQQADPPPLRQQQGQVMSQKLRIEVGQQMVLVDDHDDNHNDDNNTTISADVPDQSEHKAYLDRVAKGKDSVCTIWNDDPYAKPSRS